MTDKIQNLIDIALAEGDEIFFKLLDQCPEINEDDPRRTAMLLGFMTNCIVQLHARGWSERDLINEVFTHCEIARNIMEDGDI